MSRRPRRNHSPAFKAKVALDAIRGEKTLIELAKLHEAHPNQRADWKQSCSLGRKLHAKSDLMHSATKKLVGYAFEK